MKELIERLTAATGPSRELDEAIFEAAHGRQRRRSTFEQYEPSEPLPDYTASLDSALTLVPKGWTTQIYGGGWLRDWTVTIRSPDIKYRRSGGGQGGPDDYVLIPIEGQDASGIQCKTAALALCIAALRAREQQP